jgi:hypothetical protein
MKKWDFLIIVLVVTCLNACTNSTQSKAESAVKSYLKDNLNNPDSYCPVTFSKIVCYKKGSNVSYTLLHVYTVLNSDRDKVKMSVPFILDENFRVQEKELFSINGDYGLLEVVEQ